MSKFSSNLLHLVGQHIPPVGSVQMQWSLLDLCLQHLHEILRWRIIPEACFWSFVVHDVLPALLELAITNKLVSSLYQCSCPQSGVSAIFMYVDSCLCVIQVIRTEDGPWHPKKHRMKTECIAVGHRVPNITNEKRWASAVCRPVENLYCAVVHILHIIFETLWYCYTSVAD